MQIGLYESSIQPLVAGDFNINAGCQMIFSFNLVDSLKFCVIQTNLERQDFALRCHISVDPGDTSVDSYRPLISFWGVRRNDIIKHAARTPSSPVLGDAVDVELLPGVYHLNVLNLTNSDNSFSIIVYSA